MSPFFDPYKNQPFKRVMVCVVIFFSVAVLWYAGMRVMSPHFKVQIIELSMSGPAEENTENPKTGLDIGCWNIAHGRGDEQDISNFRGGDIGMKIRRLLDIGTVFKEAELDIVVLNEVDFQSIWSKHVNQTDFIARTGQFPYTARQRNVDISFPFCHFKFGNAILSKFPIVKAEAIEFEPYSRLEKWTAGNHDGIVCTIEPPEGTRIRVIAVHLESRSGAVRVRCARKLIKIVKSSDLPAIVMGDFNSTSKGFPGHRTGASNRSAMDILFQSGLFDPAPMRIASTPDNFTFPSTDPARAIDWILVTKPLKIFQYNVLNEKLSDHRPVTAKIIQHSGLADK